MARPRITASQDNKDIARYVANAFGGTPNVTEYGHDEIEELTVGILRCHDRPDPGVTSYSTVKVSDYPMLDEGREFPTRLELCTACATEYEVIQNVLATAAFIIMRTHRLCFPGAVLEDAVREYEKDTPLPHLYLTSPFLWEDELKSLTLPSGKVVTWLLAFPISDSELNHLEAHGAESLETLFESAQIDIFNPHRPPAL